MPDVNLLLAFLVTWHGDEGAERHAAPTGKRCRRFPRMSWWAGCRLGGHEGGGASVGERAPVLEKLSNEHVTAV